MSYAQIPTKSQSIGLIILAFVFTTGCRRDPGVDVCQEMRSSPPEQRFFEANVFLGDERPQFISREEIFARVPNVEPIELGIERAPEIVRATAFDTGIEISSNKLTCEAFIEKASNGKVQDVIELKMAACQTVTRASLRVNILPPLGRDCNSEQLAQRPSEEVLASAQVETPFDPSRKPIDAGGGHQILREQ